MEGLEGNWVDLAELAEMIEVAEMEDFDTLFTGVKLTDSNDMESSDAVEAGPPTAPYHPILQARAKGSRSQNPRHTSPTKQHPPQTSGFLNNLDPNILNGMNNQQNATVPSIAGFQFGTSTQSNVAAPSISGFQFGSSTQSNTAAPLTSGFHFGASTQSNTAAPSTSGFQFGASTQSNTAASPAIAGGRNVQSFRLSTDPTPASTYAPPSFNFTANGASSINNPFSSTPATTAVPGGRNVQAFAMSTDPTPAPIASHFSFGSPNGALTNNSIGNTFATSPHVNNQSPQSSFEQTSHSIDVETEMSEAVDHVQEQQAPVTYDTNKFVNNSMNGFAGSASSQFSPHMKLHPAHASQVDSSGPSIMDQLTGTTAPQSQPQMDSQSAPALPVENSAPAYDAKATLMPPEIPDFLSESQKRQFVTGYRFKSLLVSLFTQVKNPSEPLDIEVFRFYEEKKRDIIAAQGLPAAISLKRMASDNGRTDTGSKRVNTNGPVTDGLGASRPTFKHHESSKKRTHDNYRSRGGYGFDGACDDDIDSSKTAERNDDYDNSKKARRDDVAYPSLPSTHKSKTVDLFQNVVSGSKTTSDSGGKSTASSTANQPIAKLPGTTTPSTDSDGSEPPKKLFNPRSSLKPQPVAEPATGTTSKDSQPSKAFDQDFPLSALEPNSGNRSLFQPKAGANAISSQPSTSLFGSKSTSDIPAKSSSSIKGNDASTTTAPAPPASAFNSTPAKKTKSSDMSVASANASGSTGATAGAKPTGFSVPKFGATSGVNFMAQFGQVAKVTEEESAKKEKAKRKADEFDSDEDDEAEWERKYAAEQQVKRQKIEEAKKAADIKFVPVTGAGAAKEAPGKAASVFQFKPSQGTTSHVPEKASSLFQSKPTQAASSQGPEKTSSLFQFKPSQAASSQAPEKASTIFGSKPTPAATSSSFSSTKLAGSASSAHPQTEKPSKPVQFKATEPISSGIFGATKAAKSILSAQPQSGKPSMLFDFKPTEPTSNGTFGAAKPGNSLTSATPPSTSQPQTDNIFGHLSNQASDAEEGKADDGESEESDEDEPLPPPKPQASLSAPDQANDTSNSSSRSTSKSLFERIETNANGTPRRENPPPGQKEAGEKAKQSLTNPKTFVGENPTSTSESLKPSFFAPANTGKTSNIFGQSSNPATASNPFQSVSAKNDSSGPPSSGPQLDRTWKNDSPIKFTNVSNAPSLSVTGPSPTKTPSTEQKTGSWTGLFGSPIADTSASPFKPSSSLFGASSANTPGATVGFNFGGPSKPLTGLAAPSVFSSTATSRATSPGVSTGGESGNEDDAPAEEQLDLANARAGEENEDSLFEAKARAREHGFDSTKDKEDWILRGQGNLRVLRHRETNKARIVFRVDPGGKIILNTALMGNAVYKLATDKAIVFVAPKGDANIARWMISVASKDEAKRLAELLEENKYN